MVFVANLPPPRTEECSDIASVGGIFLPKRVIPRPYTLNRQCPPRSRRPPCPPAADQRHPDGGAESQTATCIGRSTRHFRARLAKCIPKFRSLKEPNPRSCTFSQSPSGGDYQCCFPNLLYKQWHLVQECTRRLPRGWQPKTKALLNDRKPNLTPTKLYITLELKLLVLTKTAFRSEHFQPFTVSRP